MRIAIRASGLVVAAALLFFTIRAYIIAWPMNEVDYVVQWDVGGLARDKVKRMLREDPPPLEAYRRIVLEAGSWYNVADVADRMGYVGSPPADVPVLIDCLERTRRSFPSEAVMRVESALRRLSELDLPDGTPPDEWRRQWLRKTRARKALPGEPTGTLGTTPPR